MSRHMYNWNIVAWDVKQPPSLSTDVQLQDQEAILNADFQAAYNEIFLV